METKVKVDGFENTKKTNELLRRIIWLIYPLTPQINEIEVGKEFSIIPFSKKTKEEHLKDIIYLMNCYS